MMRKGLSTFTHIFTQNKESEQLLNSIGLTSVSHAGDTRFDRVYAQLQMNNSLPFSRNLQKRTTHRPIWKFLGGR
jgi:3-deoxy-D-manno-octulosonic-acid transferase